MGSGRMGSSSNPRVNRYIGNQSVSSNGNNVSGHMVLSSIENNVAAAGVTDLTMNDSNNG